MTNVFCQLMRSTARKRESVWGISGLVSIMACRKRRRSIITHPVNLMAFAALGILLNNYTTEDGKSGSPATSSQPT